MSILKLLSNQGFISYNKIIARTCGVNEAILIGELCSIQDYFRTEEFYIIQERISNDTALSIKQIRTTLLNLEEKGIISISRKGVPCKNYYKINAELLNEIIKNGENQPENSDLIAQTEELDVTKGNNLELQKVTTREEKREHLLNNKNTDIRIQNKNTDKEDAPSYIKEKEKIINQSVSKEYQNLQEQMFNIISDHNSKVDNSKKIPISKNYWQFVCKESRMFLDKIGLEESPDDVLRALKNFISLTLRGTWQKYFSWKMFVNNYRDYTPEYFDISKYIDTPKNDEEIKTMTQSFADENLMKDWFNYAIFHHNRKKWIQAGQPEGTDFKKWADDCLCEDVKNGRANPDGDYF